MKHKQIIFSFLLHSFPLFFSILIMVALSGCTTTEEALETEQEIQANKKVTLAQEQEIQTNKKVMLNKEIDGEDTSLSFNEETEENKQNLSLFGQSEERCYVDADATKSEFDPTLLSSISVSLISEFLKEVEPLPPAGLPMDACVYLIGSVKAKGTTFVTFKGKNLNSYGNSKLTGPDGFQEAVLNALYRALEDKRKLICDAYGEYIEKCGGTVKKIPTEKIGKIREMKNEYDQLGKRITVLDTRIERMNSALVADKLILVKGTLFFHYLNYQWEWFMNSNGDKFEGEYFGEIVSLKPHGTGILTYPNGFKSGDGKVELRGEWKEGKPWNVTRHNKSGQITGKWVNGVMIDEPELATDKQDFIVHKDCVEMDIPEASRIKTADSRKPIVIPLHNWSSQVVMAYVIGGIFESIGDNAAYVPADSQAVFESIRIGDVTISHEIWEKAFGKSFETARDKGGLLDWGCHAAITQEEMGYPNWVVEKGFCPGLPNWEALKNPDCVKNFVTPDSGRKGRWLEGPQSWNQVLMPQRLKALGLADLWTVKFAGSADSLWAELKAAKKEGRGTIIFNWTPNFTDRTGFTFIKFPPYYAGCRSADGGDGRCGSPVGYLKKAVNEKFPKTHPHAARIFKKLSFTTSQIGTMAALVDTDKFTHEDAAKKWLADNEAVWKPWTK